MFKVDIIPCLSDNYSYLIYDTKKNIVGIIDPSEAAAVDKIITKKYNKLDFIFNTHHHFDHVGGNKELKQKYNSKIIGSEIDKERIPEIDILLNDKDIFLFGNTYFEIILVPGHTKGHIAFYSKKEKVLFTGDTLFSLGCGKLFEGTFKEMYNKLEKIKKLPKNIKIYFGHEYTKKNLDFCLKYDEENEDLKKKARWLNKKLSKNLPTTPTTLEDELKTNIFLRCDNNKIKKDLKMSNSSDELFFEKLRNFKDKF